MIISRHIEIIRRYIEIISRQNNIFFFTVPNCRDNKSIYRDNKSTKLNNFFLVSNCRDNKSIYQDNYVGYIKINISWGGPNTLP